MATQFEIIVLEKLDAINTRLDGLESELHSFKNDTRKNFEIVIGMVQYIHRNFVTKDDFEDYCKHFDERFEEYGIDLGSHDRRISQLEGNILQ